MAITTPARKIAAITAALVLPLSFAACSSGGSTSGSPAGGASSAPASAPSSMSSEMSSPSASSSASSSSSMGTEPFGSACSQVPATGAGSFDGMSTEPVATAASANPVLSTLVKAVTTAGLVDTLNSAEDITVFAPTNGAFEAMDQATLEKALADKELLTQVLTLHVVEGRLSPEQLAGTHKTLNGAEITVTGSGEDFSVGEAKVVCGNVQTANATVYIIDQVLLPA